MAKIVKSIRKIKTQTVYDVTVEGEHHYIQGNGLVSHNSGVKYAASTIIYLSKRKDKNSEGEVVGNIIHCKLHKGRFTKENKMVDVRLNYDSGLDKYYGLLDIAIKYNIVKKVSTRIEFPTGEKAFESQVYKNPERYFTADVMAKLEVACKTEFCYGSAEETPTEKEEID